MSRTSTRISVLAALAALLVAGIAMQGDSARTRRDPVGIQPDPLVGTLSDDELGKFSVVDMADALGRAARTQGTRAAK